MACSLALLEPTVHQAERTRVQGIALKLAALSQTPSSTHHRHHTVAASQGKTARWIAGAKPPVAWPCAVPRSHRDSSPPWTH